MTESRINQLFDAFEEYLDANSTRSLLSEANRMFNCEESGFALAGRTKDQAIAEKGTKIVHELKNSDKQQITMLAAISANGEYLPPMIILPGERLGCNVNPIAGAPKGSFVTGTKSGWIDSKAFFGYIANVFHKFLVQKQVPFSGDLVCGWTSVSPIPGSIRVLQQEWNHPVPIPTACHARPSAV